MAVHEADLDRMLRDVAARIEWPKEPPIAARVRARIEAGPARVPSWRDRLRPVLTQPSFAVTLAIVAFCAVLIASESARVAVADFLGLDGVRIEFTEGRPDDVGTRLDLGDRVTLDEARSAVDFGLLVPTAGDLDAPDRVYFDSTIGDGQVSFVYHPRKGLPPTVNENVGSRRIRFRILGQGTAHYRIPGRRRRRPGSDAPRRQHAAVGARRRDDQARVGAVQVSGAAHRRVHGVGSRSSVHLASL
jgi:hypothetical protein